MEDTRLRPSARRWTAGLAIILLLGSALGVVSACNSDESDGAPEAGVTVEAPDAEPDPDPEADPEPDPEPDPDP
ncbi:MAG: hypothetical protein U1B78_03095 [Dehalococcoidia bacterium]|nr:hypothetical protein [Dehalococcoidia bacterium]